jgi:hypothetical protein
MRLAARVPAVRRQIALQLSGLDAGDRPATRR